MNTEVRELEAKTIELENQYSKFVSTLNHIFSQIMNAVELTRRMNEEIGRRMILVRFSGLFQLMYLIYSNNEDNYRSKKDGNNENNRVKLYDSTSNNQVV